MRNEDLCGLVGALRKKYLVAEGLMLRIKENQDILTDVLGEIDCLFDAIISGCSNLSDGDCLPGTKSCKTDILNEKHEFDARVREWLDSVESALLMDTVVNVAETPLQDIHDGDVRSTYTRRSGRFSSSTVNYERKEGFV